MHSFGFAIGCGGLGVGALSANAGGLAKQIDIFILPTAVGAKNQYFAIVFALKPLSEMFKLLCRLVFGLRQKKARTI